MTIDKKQVIFLVSFVLANAATSLGVFFIKEYYKKTHPIVEIKEREPEKRVMYIDSEGISFLNRFKPEKMGRIAKTVAYKRFMDEIEKRDVSVTINFKKNI